MAKLKKVKEKKTKYKLKCPNCGAEVEVEKESGTVQITKMETGQVRKIRTNPDTGEEEKYWDTGDIETSLTTSLDDNNQFACICGNRLELEEKE